MSDSSVGMVQREVPAETVLFLEGDSSTEMYILIEGVLELSKGGGLLRRIDRPGSILGEMATLLGHRRSATLRVLEDATLLIVDDHQLEKLLMDRPEIGRKLCVSLAERLDDLTEQYTVMRDGHELSPDGEVGTVAKGAPKGASVSNSKRSEPEGGFVSRPEADLSPPPPALEPIPGINPDLEGERLVVCLTQTPLHERLLLESYRAVGRYLNPVDLARRCSVDADRFEVALGDFVRAGLIERRGENDLFWRLPSREQWIAIEDWATRNGG